jgi:hypothetical protein
VELLDNHKAGKDTFFDSRVIEEEREDARDKAKQHYHSQISRV